LHRYIAFAWNSRAAARVPLFEELARRLKSILPEWQCAFATAGLNVYHIGARAPSSQVYLLDRSAGVVLGTLFERDMTAAYYRQSVAFSAHQTQEILRTKGRHLVDRYWGRYVALIREEGGVHVRILRDPTGAMPCFVTTFRGIDVVCSHIEDCAALGLVNSAINWPHIAAYLWFRRLVTSHTGLNDVRQVQAGECLAIGADAATATFYWRPDRVHDERRIEDRQQAMHELRTAVQNCVTAWASCYSHILHELSGGLDSAVVLACLARTTEKSKIICENFFTQSAQGDERAFAQKAAGLAGIDLIETPLLSSTATLESMLDSRKVATPTLTNLMAEYRLTREELIKAHNIEVVFSGQGGDHFFQQEATQLIAAEYAWNHGWRSGLVDVIVDTARLTRTPIWSVMAKVISSVLIGRNDDPYQPRLKPPALVSESTRDALDLRSLRHSWVDDARHLPGSKILQIFYIADSQNFYHIPSLYADMVHPLISQPIVELCLQIPSYVLTYGGIDRALVREAFIGVVPPEIIGRTIKGGTASFINGLLVSNLPFLQQYLLDGLLTEERLLDRQKTEVALTEANLIRDPHLIFPVLSAVQAEAWLRAWISATPRATA